MEHATPDKMKVAELRAALQERGLDTKGTKPVLVARLQEAFDAEKVEEAPVEEAPVEEAPVEEAVPEVEAAEVPVEEAVQAESEDAKMETPAEASEVEAMETEAAPEVQTEEAPAAADAAPEAEAKTEVKAEEQQEDAKGVKRKADEEPPFEVKENEPEIPESLVCLDWHNSDLNLRITDTYMSGIPFSRDGWGMTILQLNFLNLKLILIFFK
jgi:heterogeneous nuclear ribonucleoprotein U-like protein 1